ncbi:MAG: hypothetical protein WDO15_04845 [Bacteroidota bacterium]
MPSDIETRSDKIYYYACFPDSLKVNSDNFTLTARGQNGSGEADLVPMG